MRRRDFARLAAMAAAMPMLARAARADEWLHDQVVVYADHALRPVLTRFGGDIAREHGVKLRLFTASPGQSIGLLAHNTQGDLLLTLTGFMDRAAEAGVIGAGRKKLWRNSLVFAARGQGGAAAPADPASLEAALAGGRLAVTDPTTAATFDGFAVLDKLGVRDKLGARVQGAANTPDALGMLRDGAVALALVHASEAMGSPEFRVALTVPATAHEPIEYEVALAKKAWSRNQDKFIAWLGAEGATIARAHGLEVLA